jgi:hypothetical protein
MEVTKTSNEHVLITPPDRYWSDAYNILLIDFEWGLAEHIINPLRSSSIDLAVHIYTTHDTNTEWLLNVANACDIILMDLNQITNNDIIKGQLISKYNVWYTGRKDLQQFWTGYTEDPLTTLLIEIEKYQNSRGDQ